MVKRVQGGFDITVIQPMPLYFNDINIIVRYRSVE